MLATGSIFYLHLPSGAYRQCSGCPLCRYLWMLYLDGTWGHMSSAAPPGCSRDVSVCPRQLSMEWGFTAVAKKGSELQFEEDKPFYITKGNHRIVSVGLSWYLWAMYRQKYSLGKSRVCLRDEQRFRESAPSPFSHCLYLHCVGGSCMTFFTWSHPRYISLYF